jgi:acylphosphatase
MILLTAIVSGRVQHVGYRSRVVTMAKTLDLKGYVKNLADGRVYVAAEGEREDLERFYRAICIEDPLIKVEDIEVHLFQPKGAWDDFYKVSWEMETDSRLDTATVFLKELIVVVKDGFKEANTHLCSMDRRLESMDGKLDQIAMGQDKIVHKIDAAKRDIVSEVRGLRQEIEEGAHIRFNREKADWTARPDDVKQVIHIKPS